MLMKCIFCLFVFCELRDTQTKKKPSWWNENIPTCPINDLFFFFVCTRWVIIVSLLTIPLLLVFSCLRSLKIRIFWWFFVDFIWNDSLFFISMSINSINQKKSNQYAWSFWRREYRNTFLFISTRFFVVIYFCRFNIV